MPENYLMVHKSILPDYYEKVLYARRLLERGAVRDVSQAVKEAGISRSTYYKYKDFIFEPLDLGGERKAVIDLMLKHEPGMLCALLSCVSAAGASVLTINQSLPIRGRAGVTLTLSIGSMGKSIAELMEDIKNSPGVENPRLADLE